MICDDDASRVSKRPGGRWGLLFLSEVLRYASTDLFQLWVVFRFCLFVNTAGGYLRRYSNTLAVYAFSQPEIYWYDDGESCEEKFETFSDGRIRLDVHKRWKGNFNIPNVKSSGDEKIHDIFYQFLTFSLLSEATVQFGYNFYTFQKVF